MLIASGPAVAGSDVALTGIAPIPMPGPELSARSVLADGESPLFSGGIQRCASLKVVRRSHPTLLVRAGPARFCPWAWCVRRQ